MKKNPFILLICLIGNVLSLQAQTTLSGEIVDKSDNALSSVQIDFNNGLIKTVSDNAGKFTLTYPDTLKNRSIRFQLIGYKTKNMFVNKGQQTMRVVLPDSVYNLNAAVVSVSRSGRFSDYSAQTAQMTSFDIVTNPAGHGGHYREHARAARRASQRRTADVSPHSFNITLKYRIMSLRSMVGTNYNISSDTRFLFLGVFFTFSKSKTVNELKNL